MKKIMMLALCAVLATALAFGAFYYRKETDRPVENAGTAQNAVAEPVSLSWQGTEYPMKENIQTVLVIGTDSVEAYQEEEKFLDYYNFSQADVLMLLVMDNDAKTAEIIQLNRDTMTDVPWLDVLGNYGGTEYKQLCLAFNYGDGGAKSCKNTVQAVSTLLFDAPIDGYVQLPMSAIAVLNDLVGGVPVTLEEDMTVIDPDFIQGATIRLTGKQAEKFLRARMALEDDTNLSRMRRQRTYLDSFRNSAQKALQSNPDFSVKLVEALAEYLQSNLTAQQLSGLLEKLNAATVSPIRYPDGELILGQEYYEFYVEESSLWELVKRAYCK